MKKNILPFLLGVLVVMTLAFNSQELLTVKPATPKSVLVKPFVLQQDSEEVAEYVKSKIKLGYIVKTVGASNDGELRSTWVVVMEKY